MDILKTLQAKRFNLTGNIDDRYFKLEDDGSYSVTPTFLYNVARDAEKFYKDTICRLDTDSKYCTSEVQTVTDKWASKRAQEHLESLYGDKLKDLENLKRKWREDNYHPDDPEKNKCYPQAGGPDLGDVEELRYFAGYSPEVKPNLAEAVSVYKALKQLEPDRNAIKSNLPQKPDKLQVLKKYSSEYEEAINGFLNELKIDKKEYDKAKVKETVTETRYKMKQIRNDNFKAVTADDSKLMPYIEGLINYLTSNTKVDFNNKRKEGLSFIDQDFIVTLGETTKELKAERDFNTVEGIDEIFIFTKMTESTPASKIISITRTSPTEDYYYSMNINTKDSALNFKKKISTKADLSKALQTTITMIEDVPEFKKYVKDFEALIEKL